MLGERYRAAAEDLLGALGAGCGVPEDSLERAEERLGLRLPPALREYYLALGALAELNEAHNRLLGPGKWFLDAGKLVFLVENQAVVYWGVEATEQPEGDPPVFQGVNRHPEPIEWHPEHERCSEFLLVMLHWQAVLGGLEFLGTADVGVEVIRHFEQRWKRVGEVKGLLAFRREGQAACFVGEGDSQQLYVGCRSEKVLERIASELQALGAGLDYL